jgi:hypothetical protein
MSGKNKRARDDKKDETEKPKAKRGKPSLAMEMKALVENKAATYDKYAKIAIPKIIALGKENIENLRATRILFEDFAEMIECPEEWNKEEDCENLEAAMDRTMFKLQEQGINASIEHMKLFINWRKPLF